MLIRRETSDDIEAISAVTDAAFRKPDGDDTVEARLVHELRRDRGWLPELSLVAVDNGEVVGHVVCTRAMLGGHPALGLGPLSVHPDRQRQGVGKALMHAVLGAADALGEPVVLLLGDPHYYSRFGFRLAQEIGVTPPVASWAPHFQGRTLTTYTAGPSRCIRLYGAVRPGVSITRSAQGGATAAHAGQRPVIGALFLPERTARLGGRGSLPGRRPRISGRASRAS